ncbi:hypothetical protein B6U93_01690 [Candidatus Woesearchaeota archaeon ex4484_78]|nr:MAG: hypothetical protein B6U93_01690 [Candidatus Woesearchaeota archaeon ex4484_78]
MKYIKRKFPEYIEEEDIIKSCNVDSKSIHSLRANGYLDAQHDTVGQKVKWRFRLTPIGYSHLIEHDIKILTIWIIFLTIVSLLISISELLSNIF